MRVAAKEEDHEEIGGDACCTNDGNQDCIPQFGWIDEAINRLEDHRDAQGQ